MDKSLQVRVGLFFFFRYTKKEGSKQKVIETGGEIFHEQAGNKIWRTEKTTASIQGAGGKTQFSARAREREGEREVRVKGTATEKYLTAKGRRDADGTQHTTHSTQAHIIQGTQTHRHTDSRALATHHTGTQAKQGTHADISRHTDTHHTSHKARRNRKVEDLKTNL